MTSAVKRYILLGDSGAGKSSLINFLYNYCYGTRNPDNIFNETQQNVVIAIPCQHWEDRTKSELKEKSTERNVTDQTQSQTMGCSIYPLHFEQQQHHQHHQHHIKIELIDTPGFNDSHGVGQDDTILHQIESVLQSIPYLSGLIIVANGSHGRLGTAFQHSMHQLQQVLPDSLRANVCAVLTNCDETSCNLSLKILRDQFGDIKVFYIQNSLFRWNRTHRGSSNTTMANLRRHFEENLNEVDKLIGELEKFEDISTIDVIKSGEKQTHIQQSIDKSIRKILDLIENKRQQSIASHGLQGAHMTMAANQRCVKQETMTAFKWKEVEPGLSSVDTSLPTQTPKKHTAPSPTSPPPAARNQFGTSSTSGESAPHQSSSISPSAFHRQHSHTGTAPSSSEFATGHFTQLPSFSLYE